MEKYLIGDTAIVWDSENLPLVATKFMEIFRLQSKKKVEQTILCTIRYADLSKIVSGENIHKASMYEIYRTSEGNFILYHWASCRFAFGFYLEDLEKGNNITYYFNPEMKSEVSLDMVRFLSCSGIHSKLLQNGAIIFHSSYIDWDGYGILFCGPSGVGKSTQADLWRKYVEAEIINGDRTLIKRKNGIWYAYGYPCCGSSRICLNRTLPLQAIVVLEQGNENCIETMTLGQKVKTVLSGSERYLWSEVEWERVYNISVKLATEMLIIKLICKPNVDAVNVLKMYLENSL